VIVQVQLVLLNECKEVLQMLKMLQKINSRIKIYLLEYGTIKNSIKTSGHNTACCKLKTIK
jgi:DNA integrity scanning protein DisA with diadenylate cyclase activity